jgi:glycine oxidase
MSETADVVIVGAGIVGSTIARALARAGRRVRVLEKSIPGAEASSVAAGILAPLVEHDAGPLRALGVRSREQYAQLAPILAAETGIDIGFVRSGVMRVALDAPQAAALHVPEGTEAKRLDGDEARRREPGLSPAVVAAIDLPLEAQVEAPRVLRAMVASAERAGAHFTSGAAVRGLVHRGGRVIGVDTDQGEVHAEHVVVAAGAWTSLVPGLPSIYARAVRPVRGQVVRAELRASLARRIVFAEGVYVVPRPDGRVVLGATMEEVGFSKENTIGGVARLTSAATHVLPALADARFVEADVSFRPASSDGLPLLGPAGPDGLWLAAGHFRNGILLAPVTGEILAAQITGEKLDLDAAPFDPRRLEKST